MPTSRLIPKRQYENYTEIPDKTYVSKPLVGDLLIKRLPYTDIPYQQKLDEYYKNRPVLSDKDVSDYYSHLQSAYNDYLLGYGITGGGTDFNPNTKEGCEAISSNTNYALSNALNIVGLTLGLGGITAMKGITPNKSYLGTISDYLPFKIGEGAESMVYNNSPTTVGKISFVGSKAMMEKNGFPLFEPLKKKGVVFRRHKPYSVFILRKLRIPSKEETPKYLKKLDKKMLEKGYMSLDIGNDAERIYMSPDKEWFMDDIRHGNIGVDFFGRPKIIDFTPITREEYADLYLMAE